MSKFKFPEFKKVMADIEAAEEKAAKENEAIVADTTNAICNITQGADDNGGGEGGTHVLVATDAYKKWLTTVQKKNVFIGKSYMTSAHEYERDSEVLSREQVLTDEDMQKMLTKDSDGNVHISDNYDPNGILTTDDDKLTGTSAKFADLCTINKIVSKQLSWDFDSLMKEVSDALMNEHADDEDFTLPDNLEEQVSTALKRSEAIARLTYNK